MNIREIAKRAGVSPAAVSIVINNRKGVSESTRNRILSIIKETGYVAHAKSVSSGKVLIIRYVRSGLLVEENQGFIASMVHALQKTLNERDITAISTDTGEMESSISQIDFSEYEGIVIVASEMTQENYGTLADIPIPFVVIDNLMPGFAYPCVGIDNAENLHAVLKYCVEKGIRRIGYLKSSLPAENFNQRSEAFFKYAADFNIEVNENCIFEITPSLRFAHKDMRKILEQNPTLTMPECFFADNDIIALGSMKAIKEFGIRVPEDVSIIGFDNIPYSGVSTPTLSTIHVQRERIGRFAADVLLREIEIQENLRVKITFTGTLKKRQSL